MKKIFNSAFSMALAGITILVFAITIGLATFIENDFGTETAQKIIFKSWWFEIILLYFGANIIVNIIRFKMFQLKKWSVFLFHFSFLIILLGAAITRYYGFEGNMPIREGSSSDEIISSNAFLQIKAIDSENEYYFSEQKDFAGIGSNEFKHNFSINGKSINVKLLNFIPNATKSVIEDNIKGYPIINLVVAGNGNRENYLLESGKTTNIHNIDFNFESPKKSNGIQIKYINDTIFLKMPTFAIVNKQMTGSIDTIKANHWNVFLKKSLYSFNNESFVLKEFFPSAKIIPSSTSIKMDGRMDGGLILEVSTNEADIIQTTIWGRKGIISQPTIINLGETKLELAYGSKRIKLPFSLYLDDFQLERYPGSNSPSSYASEITLIDKQNNKKEKHRIYMNHVLDYRGYRFFQSSYQPDEKGTVLSVNHDSLGTIITYIGYFLLTIGMLAGFFTPKTRFRKLINRLNSIQEKRKGLTTLILISFFIFSLNAQHNSTDSIKIIPLSHAKNFGEILSQDRSGRIKPINTLSSEVLRKISHKSHIYGLNSDQFVLSMMFFPEQWQNKPLIYVKHPKLKALLGITGDRAAFSNFFDDKMQYVLADKIEEVNQTKVSLRDAFMRDIINVDEKVNIAFMVFTGDLLRIFPRENDENNKWFTPNEVKKIEFGDAAVFVDNFTNWYKSTIEKGFNNNEWGDAEFALQGLKDYQNKYGSTVIPTKKEIDFEILYNKLNIFIKLLMYYSILGLILLILSLINIFNPKLKLKWPMHILFGLTIIAFLFHTAGLGMRWYFSGHAPWSNAYESLIYIAWSVLIAGLFLYKRSSLTLAATILLSTTILGVAALNWLEPTVTPLVPVLKSYWLNIHVSLIVASYGPLVLAGVLGFINLILMSIRNKNNHHHITLTIQETTIIMEIFMTIGLSMLTIGTYLGGVWANESWGRYWGWDPKETWALVSILVYAFILHLRFIPGMKSIFTFNFSALLGIASIMMTYFGVNYYLSGLHSYASGEPPEIPLFLYYFLGIIALVSAIAYYFSDTEEKYI